MYITSKIEIKREKNRRSKQKREYKKKLEVNLNFHYVISDIWQRTQKWIITLEYFALRKSFIRVCDYLMHNEFFCLALWFRSIFCLLYLLCVPFFLFCTSIYFCEPTSVCLWVCDTRFVLVTLLWCVQSDNNSFGSVHTSSSCYTYEIYLIIIDAELQSSLNRLIFRLVFISPSYFTLSALKIHPSQSIIFNALHGSIGGLSCSLFFILPHFRWFISFFAMIEHRINE